MILLKKNKPKDNSFQRIGIILITGLVLIVGSLVYRNNIHNFLRNRAPSFIKEFANSISKYVCNSNSIPEITKDINQNLESGMESKNPFDLPDEYRFNFQSFKKYRSWINETIETSKKNKDLAIIIDKAAYTLILYKAGVEINSFFIELGFNAIDDKFLEGDGCTPEGKYMIEQLKDIGQTSYHRAFLIDYPRPEDEMELLKLKAKGEAPLGAKSGSLIEIHGCGSGNKGNDTGNNWTLGCVALSNSDINVLFSYGVKEKVPVTIVRYGMIERYD